MTVKAEFVISARDKTREAIDGAQKRLESLERTARMLRYAFAGYIFAEFIRGVTDTEIKLQSMRFTLEAATGSMSGARHEMQFLFQTADHLGLSINDVGQYFARMAAVATSSGYSLKQFQKEFVNISGGMRVLHLDARHTQYAWLAIQEIMAQGTVKMRHLTRQLSIDFPTALQAAALGMHKTTGQLLEMAHAGTLASQPFLHGLSKGLLEMYGPQVQAASQGLQADLTRVSNAFTEAVNSASKTGAFDTFGQAMNQLAATMKSPGFMTAFSEFITGMATIAKWSTSAAEHTAGALDRISLALRGLSEAEMMPLRHGKNLGQEFDILNTKIAALKSRIDQIKHPGFDIIQSGYNLFDYQGQKKHLDSLMAQVRLLESMRSSISARIGREGSNSPYHPANQGAHIGRLGAHIDRMTASQKGALKVLANMQDALQRKLDGFQSKLQLAQGQLAKFKPGTAGYSEAAAEVKMIRESIAAIDKKTKAREAQKKALEQLHKEQEKQQHYLASLQKDANHWKDTLAPMRKVREEAKRLTEEYQRGMLSWTQFMAAMKKSQHDSQKVFGSMNQYAISAARNMQSAFAQFLYNPFEGGLRGMLHSFADTLRKMVAQWLAAQAIMQAANALKGAGGWEGKLGSVLASMGSGKASGGPVHAGTVYPVGEQGPELFMPSQNGTIIPNHALGGGGPHTTINIDARGAGPDEVSKLLAMRQGLVHEIQNRIKYRDQYGHFPA